MARRDLMDDFFNTNEDLDSPVNRKEKDYGILNILNSYKDKDEDYIGMERYNTNNTNSKLDSNSKNYEENESSFLFTNSYIQNSFIRMNVVKKFLNRKINLMLMFYFDLWKDKIKKRSIKPINEKEVSSYELVNRDRDRDRDYLNANRRVIEDFCNKDESYMYSKSSISYSQRGNGTQLATLIKSKLQLCLKTIFDEFVYKLQIYNNSKKSVNHNLTLLYLFTQLTIAKNKKSSTNDNDTKIRLIESERKISKLENNLNEKASIISKKNDTIEALSEQIERLNRKISNFENKQNNLNIITESLCHKCGNSLEESFIAPQTPKYRDHISLSNDEEYKRTIQEQLDYILKLEQDCKDLRNRNMDYKSNNEMIKNELEIIKIEFKNVTDSMSRKSNQNILTRELTTQTDPVTTTTNIVNNVTNIVKTKPKKPKTATKFPCKISSSISKETSEKNSSSSLNFDYLNESKEIQSLKFDNSILSQEIVNLNRELTKLRNESKQYTDINKKLEKDKSDIITKFKQKAENYDKVKKENDELMVLIQTSNYKPFITCETENKKLKLDKEFLIKEQDQLRSEIISKEKKIFELDTELTNLKKNQDALQKFKTERDNFILENTRQDSELKRLRYEVNEARSQLEKSNIMLADKEDSYMKLSEEMNYITINTRMIKQEADRSLQEIVSYQQILRKLEKELNDTKQKNDKIEKELNVFKQQIYKK